MPDESSKSKLDKAPKTKLELETLVLAELRVTSDCGGAAHVTVVSYDDYRRGRHLGGSQLQSGHIRAGTL